MINILLVNAKSLSLRWGIPCSFLIQEKNSIKYILTTLMEIKD